MRISKKSDKPLVVAIIILAGIMVFQVGSLIERTFATDRSMRVMELPFGTKDWRGEMLPPLGDLKSVPGAYSMEELRVGPAIVAFLQTTCPACAMAKPALIAFASDHPDMPLVAVFSEPEEVVIDYAPGLQALIDETGNAFSLFEITGLPTLLAVSDGVVRQQYVGWSPEVLAGLVEFAKLERR